MYYQRESKSVNNDYYNTYKGYLNRDTNTSDLLSTIIKILAIVFLLTLIIFGYIFVSNQYYLSESSKDMESAIGVNTIHSVTSVMSEGNKKLSSEDVSQIVQMVMAKMNSLNEQEQEAKLKNSDIIISRKPTTLLTPTSKKVKFIVVKGGDTLSTIAIRVYGDESAYKKIRDANREIIKDTNKIFAGQRLRIPF